MRVTKQSRNKVKENEGEIWFNTKRVEVRFSPCILQQVCTGASVDARFYVCGGPLLLLGSHLHLACAPASQRGLIWGSATSGGESHSMALCGLEWAFAVMATLI